MSNAPIVLASSSHLRRVIMDSSKLTYKSISPDVNEDQFALLPVEDRVIKTAELKSLFIQKSQPGAIIIAADTLTQEVGSDKTNDKHDKGDYQTGKTIRVYTGMVFYSPQTGMSSRLFTSDIHYINTSPANLDRLVKDDDRTKRSGSLGIFLDSPGFGLIDKIEGRYSAAYGLDLPYIYEMLEKAGYFNG